MVGGAIASRWPQVAANESAFGPGMTVGYPDVFASSQESASERCQLLFVTVECRLAERILAAQVKVVYKMFSMNCTTIGFPEIAEIVVQP